jgi:amino acid transporter
LTIGPPRQTYIRFRAGWDAQGLDRNLLPFKSSLQPYAAWYGLVTIVVILLLSGFSVFLHGNWDTADFITNYIPLIFAPILFVAATIVMKSRFVKVEEMDFVTGLDEVIAETYDEPPPKNIWEKFWLWIVSVPAMPLPFGVCRLTLLRLQF